MLATTRRGRTGMGDRAAFNFHHPQKITGGGCDKDFGGVLQVRGQEIPLFDPETWHVDFVEQHSRELLLDEIHVPGFRIEERDLLPADLENAAEIFITSTTRNLLRVMEIEGRAIPHSGPARGALSQAFAAYVDAYVARHKEMPAAHL